MDHLARSNVPVYATTAEQQRIWDRCSDRGQPVIAIRTAARGHIVRYDLQHLDVELSQRTLQQLRDRVRSRRGYQTSPDASDPVSETEGVGGEAGAVSGELHTPTERAARDLASHISPFVLDRDNWR
ncbi:hypothetical protein [Haloarcula salinisoli]|uniref:Uncharacterized protein n=1 Tax=Haloarcula salinisoli TaxID=2487746 RepID=A0A8J7YKI7_9EURY|nr:hypothetical protein [Halomicroarcula salinisoli]MBX0285638.1 hypothetical protein [Halomicroarcula salinisoli]MBX0302873.1 hypothetical protein [Halomicroarcula salinisoli]